MKKRYKTRKNNAVSEVLGTILLLGIAVAIFSVLYFIVLSESFETNESNPTIYAFIEGKNIVLEHRGGDELSGSDYFSYKINGVTKTIFVKDNYEDYNVDNLWNFGERIYIPIGEFNLANKSVDIFGAKTDETESSIVFQGILDITPENDIGVEVRIDDYEPEIWDTIQISVIIHNYRGDINATNVNISFKLPEGLEYIYHSFIFDSGYESSNFSYDNDTGYCIVDKIKVRDSITLLVNAKVTDEGMYREKTQLAMILDGSGSISEDDWILMRNGLANAIENNSVFPHDGSVELTVIQFGGTSPPRAKLELGGSQIITESNYESIADDIRNIKQMIESGGSATPTACGIRLAADELYNSDFYSSDRRQIVNLVTDGLANCRWIEDTYNGTWLGNGWVYESSHGHDGSTHSAKSTNSNWGEFISKDIDTSNANSIHIEFYRYLYYTESNDLKIYFYDGTNYNIIDDGLGSGSGSSWIFKEFNLNINDNPEYFTEDFKIRFDTSLSNWERIWIDDVLVETESKILLYDDFEQDHWNQNWSNFGKFDSEEQIQYLLDLLDMQEEDDEIDSLAIGPGPDKYWIKNKIVWPQPGYEAPPFNSGSGWLSHIDSFDEFEYATSEMFRIQFSKIKSIVKLNTMDTRDPYSDNDEYTIEIIPKN